MNDKNLIPTTKRSKKEAREMSRKGGIKSGEARRAKKTMREQLELLLSLPISDPNFKEQLKADGIELGDLNNGMALQYVMLQKAMNGDVQAYNLIRDTSGNKPTEKIDANVKEDVSIVVTWDD